MKPFWLAPVLVLSALGCGGGKPPSPGKTGETKTTEAETKSPAASAASAASTAKPPAAAVQKTSPQPGTRKAPLAKKELAKIEAKGVAWCKTCQEACAYPVLGVRKGRPVRSICDLYQVPGETKILGLITKEMANTDANNKNPVPKAGYLNLLVFEKIEKKTKEEDEEEDEETETWFVVTFPVDPSTGLRTFACNKMGFSFAKAIPDISAAKARTIRVKDLESWTKDPDWELQTADEP